MVKSAPPRQSVDRLFFLSFFCSSNFEFPARIKKGGGKIHRTPIFGSCPSRFHQLLWRLVPDNGTTFISQYLLPMTSSLPGTAPGPLMHLGGIP